MDSIHRILNRSLLGWSRQQLDGIDTLLPLSGQGSAKSGENEHDSDVWVAQELLSSMASYLWIDPLAAFKR